MSVNRSPKLLGRIRAFFKAIGRALPTMPGSSEIDREYIEGETTDEIGEISQMTDIPDKSERDPSERMRNRKKAA